MPTSFFLPRFPAFSLLFSSLHEKLFPWVHLTTSFCLATQTEAHFNSISYANLDYPQLGLFAFPLFPFPAFPISHPFSYLSLSPRPLSPFNLSLFEWNQCKSTRKEWAAVVAQCSGMVFPWMQENFCQFLSCVLQLPFSLPRWWGIPFHFAVSLQVIQMLAHSPSGDIVDSACICRSVATNAHTLSAPPGFEEEAELCFPPRDVLLLNLIFTSCQRQLLLSLPPLPLLDLHIYLIVDAAATAAKVSLVGVNWFESGSSG